MLARIVTINRGFFHVVPEGGRPGDRVFVHASVCDFSLWEAQVGDIVDLIGIEDCGRGPRAVRCSWLERPAA